MIAKTFEIRDKATFIPVLAVRLDPDCEADRYWLARAGYGLVRGEQAGFIMLSGLAGGSGAATSDPYDWGDRTRQTAHKYIIEHFDELPSCSVVDVEYVLGETQEPKKSESEEAT